MQQQDTNKALITKISENSTDLFNKNTKINNQHSNTTCQSLINDIISCSGYSMAKISAETNIPLITLRRLRTGVTKEPRSAAFHRIFSLYCKVCLCKNIVNNI